MTAAGPRMLAAARTWRPSSNRASSSSWPPEWRSTACSL
jgi:hypothetical protein